MTKNTLKQGRVYAERLFKSVGLSFSTEIMEGEEGRTSLIIGDQAIIYNDIEAGEIKLTVYPVSLVMGQLRQMFGIKGDERDNKPPTPNYVPVENVFDAVRRAAHALVDLRVDRVAADLANDKQFQTEMDVVTHIPDRVVNLGVAPSTELALPGFDISMASPNMRTYISRENWQGAFTCFAIRNSIPIQVRDSHAHLMGDRAIRSEACFTQQGYMARTGDGDPREPYSLPRFGQCLAKKEGEDDYRIWVFDFTKGMNSVKSVGGLTEKDFNRYFTREINATTETDISVQYLYSVGFKSTAKTCRTTMGSLDKLGSAEFTDKGLKLPSGFATEYRQNKHALVVEVPGTALNRRQEVALFPLNDGSVMRIMVTEYTRDVRAKGALSDIPVRIWDRKDKWTDDVIKVSIKEDKDHTGPYVCCESRAHPEINDQLSFMELNGVLHRLLHPKPKNTIDRRGEVVPVALQNPTSIAEVRARALSPEVASAPDRAALSQGQVEPKGAAPSHE